MSTIEQRLSKLERKLARATRRNCWLAVVMVLAVGLLAAAWLATETAGPALAEEAAKPSQVIRATAFVLVDDEGRERGKLEASIDGPVLALTNEKGKTRVKLAAPTTPFGSETSLTLYDENGKFRAGLTVEKGLTRLNLFDKNGKQSVRLSVDDLSGAQLFLSTGSGKYGTVLAAHSEGMTLSLSDDKGKARAKMEVNKQGSGLMMMDENGKPRACLGAFKDGPSLDLFDENGKVIWSAP